MRFLYRCMKYVSMSYSVPRSNRDRKEIRRWRCAKGESQFFFSLFLRLLGFLFMINSWRSLAKSRRERWERQRTVIMSSCYESEKRCMWRSYMWSVLSSGRKWQTEFTFFFQFFIFVGREWKFKIYVDFNCLLIKNIFLEKSPGPFQIDNIYLIL